MRRKKDGTLGFITNRRLNNERGWIEKCLERAKAAEDHGLATRLRAVYHAVPGAIEEANAGRRIVNAEGLHRLDGQCGNALKRRGVDTKLGAKRLCVDFYVSAYGKSVGIEPVMAWYAPRWFSDLAHKMDNRRPFYRQLDKLAKEGGDAIDEHIGMLILGEM